MNTGDSLVALRYSVQSRVGQTQSDDTTPPAEVGKLHHSSHILQEFAQCGDASSSMPGTWDYHGLLLTSVVAVPPDS